MAESTDTLGRSRIGSIRLSNFNKSETQKDITALVLECNLYEDIFSPSVKLELAILDASRFAREFPIIGEEIIDIDLSAAGGDHQSLDKMEHLTSRFRTYRLDSRLAIKNRAEAYLLHATSIPHLLDYTNTVDKAYGPSTITKMVEDIFAEYIQPHTTKRLSVEVCAGLHQFVFPKLSPMRALAFLAEEGRSEKFPNSTLHFFETDKRYHFIALENLLQHKPTETFVWIPQNLRTIQNGRLILGKLTFSHHQIIIDYNEKVIFDTLIGISHGQYSTVTQSIDPLLKRYDATSVYDYNRQFEKTARLGSIVQNTATAFRTISSSDAALQTPAHSRYLTGRMSINSAFMKNRNYTDYSRSRLSTIAGAHAAMMQLQNTSTIMIRVPGYSALRAGQIINILIPRMGEGSTVNVINQYLITSLCHQFNIGGSYETVLECMKNAYSEPIQNIPSEEVGSKPRIRAIGI